MQINLYHSILYLSIAYDLIYSLKYHTLYRMMKTNITHNKPGGICYLIGGGPGDPGLLTLKAAECLQQATVVYYDYLASKELLDLVPADSKIIYVGKSAGNHVMPQEEITSLIVESVSQGEIVARLKGGDPFVFGRGGEEAIALAQAGLDFEIIPGVTSGIAAAAYAGIPVTHRAVSTMVTFVTGHETPDKNVTQTDWQALAQAGGTICIYMGIKNIAAICSKLITGGRDKTEPVAVIHRGTSSRQRTVTGNLSNIAEKITLAGISAPSMIIIGKVVDLKEQIDWFEKKPLLGKKVLVTRTREQASTLTRLLAAEGADVIEIPAIKLIPVEYHAGQATEENISNGLIKIAYMRETNPTLLSMIQDKPVNLDFPDLSSLLSDCDELTRGIGLLVANKHEWVVFTSVNGVEQVFKRIRQLNLDSRIFVGKEIAAIGSATRDALGNNGIRADLVPEEFTGEALLEELKTRDIAGRKIIMFRASNARAMLREKLAELGCEVDDIIAYRIGKAPLSPENREILENGLYDIVTFGSSATVRNFCEMSGENLKNIISRELPPKFVSIGPITSTTMEELSLPLSAQAQQATLAELVAATVECSKTE